MRHWVQVQLRSNWIEVLAIPIIASIMRAQPVFVMLIFVSPALTNSASGTSLLNEISLILLILGLRWWVMGVHASAQHGVNENNARLLYVLGLLIAGGLIIGTPILQVRTVLSVILLSALVLWFWWRGIQQVTSLDDGQLVMSFRIGFVILLIVLLFAVFYLDASYSLLFTTLAQAVPIFFLSGLLAFSFTRIALIRREIARYAPDTPNAGSTRNWLFVLTASWLAVVVAVLTLEAFSFQAVIAATNLLWSGLSIVLLWLVTLIAYVLTPVFYVFSLLLALLINLFRFGRPIIASPPPLHNLPPAQHQHFSPTSLTVGRFVLLSIALIALFFIVRTILRKVRTARKGDAVEEIRESLSLRSIVQRRREERQPSSMQLVSQLETLDPDSARAHYRDLLQAVAAHNPALTRRFDETPLEYRARLLMFARQAVSETRQAEATPSEQEILDALTHDYSLERYGGYQLAQPQTQYLRTWVPRLIARLTQK